MAPDHATYIAQLVQREDRDRFLTAQFAPPEARVDLLALYAFNAEVAKVRESVSDIMIGQIKLQWWRDMTAVVYGGGEAPKGNPVAEALAGVIRRRKLSHAHFEALFDARLRDMTDEAPADVPALEAYAEGTAGNLTSLGLECLGARDEASRAAGRHVGVAWGLTGLLRAVLFHARANRFLLPQDLMEKENLTGHDLHERRNAARIAVVVEQIAQTAARHVDEARALRVKVDKRAVPVLLLATRADQYLRGLAQRRFDVFDPRHIMQRPALLPLIWNAFLKKY